jgi:uncharacterized membrane protein (DUF373 family)
MPPPPRISKVLLGFELVTIVALQFLTIVMIGVATVVLFFLGVATIRDDVVHISTVGELLMRTQRSIAGILIVVMGLEVLETLKVYLRDHYVRLEVILIVAVIAVSRQVIEIDFEHTNGMLLLGLSALIAALTFGYFLVRRAHHGIHATTPGAPDSHKP